MLIPISRQGHGAGLDKFAGHGLRARRAAIQHSQPGLVSSLHPRQTTVTVWRPSLKQKRTFRCAPGPQVVAGHTFYQSAPPPFAWGSMVFMHASPDLLGAAEDSDDDESMHSDRAVVPHYAPRARAARGCELQSPVVVLSHFHSNAYVSSTRTLVPGDIVEKINDVVVKAWTTRRNSFAKAAAEMFSPSERKRVCAFLRPETRVAQSANCCRRRRCAPPNASPASCTFSTPARRKHGAPAVPTRRSRRITDHRAISALTIATAKALQETIVSSTPPGRAKPGAKRGRRSRPSSPVSKSTKRRRSKRLADVSVLSTPTLAPPIY